MLNHLHLLWLPMWNYSCHIILFSYAFLHPTPNILLPPLYFKGPGSLSFCWGGQKVHLVFCKKVQKNPHELFGQSNILILLESILTFLTCRFEKKLIISKRSDFILNNRSILECMDLNICASYLPVMAVK